MDEHKQRRPTKKNNKKDTWAKYGKNTSRGLRIKQKQAEKYSGRAAATEQKNISGK